MLVEKGRERQLVEISFHFQHFSLSLIIFTTERSGSLNKIRKQNFSAGYDLCIIICVNGNYETKELSKWKTTFEGNNTFLSILTKCSVCQSGSFLHSLLHYLVMFEVGWKEPQSILQFKSETELQRKHFSNEQKKHKLCQVLLQSQSKVQPFEKVIANVYLQNFNDFWWKLHECSARDASINTIDENAGANCVGNWAKFGLFIALLSCGCELAGESWSKPLADFWRHCVWLHFGKLVVLVCQASVLFQEEKSRIEKKQTNTKNALVNDLWPMDRKNEKYELKKILQICKMCVILYFQNIVFVSSVSNNNKKNVSNLPTNFFLSNKWRTNFKLQNLPLPALHLDFTILACMKYYMKNVWTLLS